MHFTVEPTKFRFEDKQLRDWLVPPASPKLVHKRPSEAFLDVAAGSPSLILHPEALKFADEMAEYRWPFANDAAVLLGRYSRGEDVGPKLDWKAKHGAHCVAGGEVIFGYTAFTSDEAIKGVSYWHLKAGDHTSREGAARIYFERLVLARGSYVIVFYVGPHPDPGKRNVSVEIANED